VHRCQEFAAVHDQPREIQRRQFASEIVERTARHESMDREGQQLAVVIHLLDARAPPASARQHRAPARSRLLVGEPRHRMARGPDDGHVVRKIDALRFVHPAIGDANDPLDLAAADRPHD
jgi:hypothetical protein